MANEPTIEAQLEQYRNDLRRIVRSRLDSRLAGRFDASDIIQNVLVSATKELDHWKRDSQKSVFACLYQLTRTAIARVHRDHLVREKRAVNREQVNDTSAVCLAERLMGRETTPSQQALRNEMRTKVREALGLLPEADGEILLMRVVEGIPARIVGEIFGISADAVNMRQLRALQRIRPHLRVFED